MAYLVLFHLTESASGKVEMVLGNIRHLLDEYAPEGIVVELVVHSDGIAALYRHPNPQADAIRSLAERGVRFAACAYTMKSRGIGADELLEVARVVPSGVGEIVHRQEEGWLYVRP